MESFLEANRVVEVSLNKFSRVSKGREMPLRKALLVSKAMSNAQEVAESAHTSFLNSVTTTRCSSRLLASMQASADVEDTAVHELDPGLVRSWNNKPRLPSPMAQCARAATVREDDMMDMESVISGNSVLSDILSNEEEDDRDMEVSPATPLTDLTNSRVWSSWPEVKATPSVKPLPLGTDNRWSTERSGTSPPPLSPGKRHHSVAFPAINENETSLFDFTEEDAKRFKPSLPEKATTASLPGWYGYLSPRNLCSAPLITYMFGRGFTTPSDPSESDWPSSLSLPSSSLRDYVERETGLTDNHFSQALSPSKLCPILAY